MRRTNQFTKVDKNYSKRRVFLTSRPLCLLVGAVFFMSYSTMRAQELIQLDAKEIAKVKKKLDDGSATKETQKVYRSLLSTADRLLEIDNPTVINKTIDPPTNDKHDYLSISRYWWPDPSKEDGKPWIRKDGETNPDTQADAVDRKRLGKMCKAVRDLSRAYYFSGREEYAKKGISIMRTWFLDTETRMNPNLEFAQSVPGINKGRRSGILDGRMIPLYVLDAITLFSDSKYWTPQDKEGMDLWLNEYLVWLTQSDLGKKGAKQENNHGSWYIFQVMSLAWYTDQKPIIATMVKLIKENFDRQFDDEGRQLHELKRTRSFFYSCFNLDALTQAMAIADKAGIDMWQYTSEQGRSLKLAIDYLLPVTKGKKWEHPTKKGADVSYLVPILARVSSKTGDKEYKKTVKLVLQEIQENEKPTKNGRTLLKEFSLLNRSAF